MASSVEYVRFHKMLPLPWKSPLLPDFPPQRCPPLALPESLRPPFGATAGEWQDPRPPSVTRSKLASGTLFPPRLLDFVVGEVPFEPYLFPSGCFFSAFSPTPLFGEVAVVGLFFFFLFSDVNSNQRADGRGSTSLSVGSRDVPLQRRSSSFE